MVWVFLPFINNHRKFLRSFKQIEPGRCLFIKDVDEHGDPYIRVGYFKRIENGNAVAFIPSLNCECLIDFDGTNFYIDRH